MHMARSSFSSPSPPVSSWQGCSQSLHPSACIDIKGSPQSIAKIRSGVEEGKITDIGGKNLKRVRQGTKCTFTSGENTRFVWILLLFFFFVSCFTLRVSSAALIVCKSPGSSSLPQFQEPSFQVKVNFQVKVQ